MQWRQIGVVLSEPYMHGDMMTIDANQLCVHKILFLE